MIVIVVVVVVVVVAVIVAVIVIVIVIVVVAVIVVVIVIVIVIVAVIVVVVVVVVVVVPAAFQPAAALTKLPCCSRDHRAATHRLHLCLAHAHAYPGLFLEIPFRLHVLMMVAKRALVLLPVLGLLDALVVNQAVAAEFVSLWSLLRS